MKAAGPYTFIGFGGIDVTRPYQFIWFIWFGDIDTPKPYEFMGSDGFYIASAGSSAEIPRAPPPLRPKPRPGALIAIQLER
jgi:hypothetical protein